MFSDMICDSFEVTPEEVVLRIVHSFTSGCCAVVVLKVNGFLLSIWLWFHVSKHYCLSFELIRIILARAKYISGRADV